uniref:riboflavin kinase n=1 Tax=Panagrolaimus superbus TaxID=310955 RepID=A0A914Y9M0_9BILA
MSASTKTLSALPIFLRGKVVRGYGRGGRELNCPTANLDETAVNSFPSDAPTGVYIGFAKVNNDKVYPMAMSVGYNVHFGNDNKTVEIHILHEFENDFYDEIITAIAIKYLRPMKQFNSKEELIEAIEEDKKAARNLFNDTELSKWTQHSYFSKL